MHEHVCELQENCKSHVLTFQVSDAFHCHPQVALHYATPLFDKTPYHTSILTGEGWVRELMTGHPDRIKTELGMR
jgi:hypothetical protein